MADDDKATVEILKAILREIQQLNRKVDEIGLMIGESLRRPPQLPRR